MHSWSWHATTLQPSPSISLYGNVCVCVWWTYADGVDRRQMSWPWASSESDNFNSFWSTVEWGERMIEDRGDDGGGVFRDARKKEMNGDSRRRERGNGRRDGTGLASYTGLSLHNGGLTDLRRSFNKLTLPWNDQMFRPSQAGYAHVQYV